MLNQENIGKFIADLRKEKHWTQEQLAEQLGVTNRSVSRWENGKTLPDLSVLMELCAVFAVDFNELLKGEKINQTGGEGKKESSDKNYVRFDLLAQVFEQEQKEKAKKANRYFLAGVLCFGAVFADVLLSAGAFLMPLWRVVLIMCAIVLQCTGFYVNSSGNNYTPREIEVLSSSEETSMKTAEEMLRFVRRSQATDKPQYKKAFLAIEKELLPEEAVQFALAGEECLMQGSPSCWQPVLALTDHRILICGESVRGRMMTAYGVDTFSYRELKKIQWDGHRLILQVGSDEVVLKGKTLNEEIVKSLEKACPGTGPDV